MRELEHQIGKIVSVKTATGLEFVGTLSEYDADNQVVSLAEPRIIAMASEGDVRIIPYTLTGQNSLVGVNLNNVLTIIPTLDQTAEDYRNFLIEEFASTPLEVQEITEDATASV